MRPTHGHTLAVTLALAVGLGGVAGCRTVASAGGGTVTPTMDNGPREVDPEGRDAGENVDTYRMQLQQLRKKRAAKMSAEETGFGACEDLCDLMSSICNVRSKLCTLADEHPGEESYQGLCREAQHECREAEDSCVECTEGLQSRPKQAPAQ